MHDIDDSTIRGAISEEILSQVKAVFEIVVTLPTRLEFNELLDRVSNIEQDVKIIRTVVTDHSKQLHNHETRITSHEKARNAI